MSPSPKDPEEEVVAESQSSARLRELLDGVELIPEQTSDDVVPPLDRDRQLLEDVPPHHG